MCGVWTVYEGKRRLAILTRNANENMAEVHDRMPVIISEDNVRAYLTSLDTAAELLHREGPELQKRK